MPDVFLQCLNKDDDDDDDDSFCSLKSENTKIMSLTDR